jgi:hypothetical protein
MGPAKKTYGRFIESIAQLILNIRVRWRQILCFVDRASRYDRVKKNQPDAQITGILSILHQPLHVSNPTRTTGTHLKKKQY